jgi:hypothetical protein
MKKTAGIEDALNRSLEHYTSKEHLLPLALVAAAKRQNVVLSEHEVHLLATAILESNDGIIQLDLDPPCGLGATEEGMRTTLQVLVGDLSGSIADVMEDITAAISQAVPDALAAVADLICEQMSLNAREHASVLIQAHARRSVEVGKIWGEAFCQLDFLRNIVLEWSSEAYVLCCGPFSNPNTRIALDRLAGRTYEIVGEIVTLARAGYADGALARWRSLHEICVIAIFLSQRSDSCALMYMAHQQVEELKLLEVARAGSTGNSHDSKSDRHIAHLRKQKANMAVKFGAAFPSDYGWASIELGCAKTTFRDLEKHVGLETLRRGYQQANSTVHGGALGTLTRISLGTSDVDCTLVPPAYGCEVAINYAAASLSIMVAELCSRTENADLVAMSIVVHNHASRIRALIVQTQKVISSDSPRARLLARKAAQRKSRGRSRRI